ncbi:Tetratricopeptide repeat-containing protein [Modestobacter sp. DSM 44400]|uniref:tetratricopeptide repeat protein n=1 Tax=Modestobacter sp. DSM 44400 TaxID=1550230 RepID=UPI000896ADD7|nr:tetratricopeptide repeat protein [Modestobacter sp. DSM 44400]SDY76010.1 Tetratricopeptide repeat-containing protein [Modestobacter sp. DSM 44400]
MRTRTAVASIVAGGLLLVAAAAAFYTVQFDKQAVAGQEQAAGPAVDPLVAAITAAQQRLEQVPGDYTTWAQLGSAYVERARITADPTYYDKADGALQQSLTLHPDGNDTALIGQGALANARHDFAGAAAFGEQAVQLNPYSATAWGVLTDARTQLGDYPGATDALQRMLRLRPGIASFTRASYDAELHGDLVNARSALEQALETAQGDSDEAYCRTYLGALAFSTGDLDEAAAQYDAGLEADPGEPTLLLGQARVLAARGKSDAAVENFQSVVDERPLPAYFVEFGEYLESLGRDAEAQQQFALVGTVQTLFAASGVQDDLTTAQFAADHGDPAAAVAAGEAEYGRRQNIDSQDALAWALHSAGRDAEALPLAQQATGIGGQNALFLYHRGAIEAALGMTGQARTTLSTALDTNPYFSPLHVPRAEELLASLGGRR